MKVLFLFFLTLVSASMGANWYVRPSAVGANTGKDWGNAWSLSSVNWTSVKAGDTLWMAGGSYGGLSVKASGTVGNPILIKRVTASDSAATSAPGWNASFDSTVALSSLGFPAANNVTVDGRVPFVMTPGAKGVKPAGMTITISMSGGDGIGGANNGNISNISCYNISIIGPYATESNPAGTNVNGINIAPGTNWATNCVFHGLSILGTGEAVRASNWDGVIIEYCYIADEANDGHQHEDILYSYPTKNCIWRFNVLNNSPNDGLRWQYGGAVNEYFYGNVYYNSEYGLFGTAAPGNYGPVYVYNNVFHAPAGHQHALFGLDGTQAPGTAVLNNIFFNVTNVASGQTNIQSDYNAYSYTSLNGYSWPTREKHSFTFDGNPFVNIPANTQPVGTIGDFHLTSAMQALFKPGIVLASDGFINKDMDGNTRGSGGNWYIGAYQYGGTPGPSPSPSPSASPTPSATPTPSPTATPVPTPTPAAKFKIGDHVVTTVTTNIRATPAGTLLGTQPAGEPGTIQAGPQDATFNGANVSWYQVVFTVIPNGWAGDDNLELGTAPSPTPAPTPTPVPTPTPPPSGPTYEHWIQQQNDWIRQNPPTPDQ